MLPSSSGNSDAASPEGRAAGQDTARGHFPVERKAAFPLAYLLLRK